MRRAIVLGFLVLATGCGSNEVPSDLASPQQMVEDRAPAESDQLLLDFDEWVVEYGTIIAGAENAGTARVRTVVSTQDSGRLRLGWSPDGNAARFPAYVEEAAPPAAALLVYADGDEDVFSPGRSDFEFGADFRLDQVSSGTDADNGDNLVQRGLMADPVQFKIQIDKGVPSCRVAGSDGAALVKLHEPVERDQWYRILCSRIGKTVTLELHELGKSGTSPLRVSVQTATGSVSMEAGVPIAIGAKVLADGSVVTSSTDQFNGSVDNVRYEVLR